MSKISQEQMEQLMRGARGPQISDTALRSGKNVACDKCKNLSFEQVFLFRTVSPLADPSLTAETNVQIPTFACNACGHINSQFLPKFMIEEVSDIQSSTIIS